MMRSSWSSADAGVGPSAVEAALLLNGAGRLGLTRQPCADRRFGGGARTPTVGGLPGRRKRPLFDASAARQRRRYTLLPDPHITVVVGAQAIGAGSQ